MHSDLVDKIISRRLRALADDWRDAPYEWAEFQRRRQARDTATRLVVRRAGMAAAAAAAALLVGFALANLDHRAASRQVTPGTAANVGMSAAEPAGTGDRRVQQRTRELEGWLAELPRNPAVVRVGAHAAVSSLQDQIAALDDLMSAERVTGSQPAKLRILERRRAQLVSSLAQLQYAEMLASATP